MVALSPIERAEQELAALQSDVSVEPQQPVPQQPSQQVTPEQQVPQQPPQDDYYQKWKSLDGMLRKKDEQISQLMAQNQEVMARFNELSDQLQASQSQARQAQAADVMAQITGEYGEDTVNAIQKVFEARYGQKVAQLEERLAQLNGVASGIQTLQADQGHTKAELFQAKLSASVPDWQQIRASQGWQQWLDSSTDEITGQTYAELFDLANSNWAMQPIVALFNKYKSTMSQAPEADPRAHLVTPGGGHGVGSSGVQQPKIWSQAEVEATYDKARRGAYTPEQWAVIDADIMSAYQEGRIR